MPRCLKTVMAALALAAPALALAQSATATTLPAQGRAISLPTQSLRGEVVFGQPPEVMLNGARHAIPVRSGETIVDAGLRAGLEMPYSCRGGMCCTCRAKVTEGEVRMDTNYSLEPWELEAGFVLTCQAHPVTAKVALDYDQV